MVLLAGIDTKQKSNMSYYIAGNNYYKLEYYRMAFKNKGDYTVLLIPRAVKLKRVKLQWK